MSIVLSPRVQRIAGPVCLATAAALVFGAGFTTRALVSESAAPVPAAIDPCALPAGLHLEALAPRDRSLVAFRHIACRDRLTGRITETEYRATVATIDAAWKQPEASPASPRAPIWAARVIGFSSQYSDDDWSANRVLGAPDVYPSHGDDTGAWAPLTADDRDEWIEVGFDQPRAISAVQIYETYSPGAVSKVELITTSGRRIQAFAGPGVATRPADALRTIETPCTTEPIAAVRVELASRKVAGWNELDAIGVVPCQ